MVTRGEAALELRIAVRSVFSEHYSIFFRPNFDWAARFHRGIPFAAADQIRNAFDHLSEPIALLNFLLEPPLDEEANSEALAQALMQIKRCIRHVELGVYDALVSQMDRRLPDLDELIEDIEMEYKIRLNEERTRCGSIRMSFTMRTPPSGGRTPDIDAAIEATIDASTELTHWLNGIDNIFKRLIEDYERVKPRISAAGA